MSDEQPAVAPPEPPWARRMVHSILLTVTLVLLWWVAGLAALYVPTYEQLEIHSMPVPTVLILKTAGLLQPAVLITWAIAGLALVAAGHFGTLDRFLLPLIVAELLFDGLLLFGWLFALTWPLRQIQEKLR